MVLFVCSPKTYLSIYMSPHCGRLARVCSCFRVASGRKNCRNAMPSTAPGIQSTQQSLIPITSPWGTTPSPANASFLGAKTVPMPLLSYNLDTCSDVQIDDDLKPNIECPPHHVLLGYEFDPSKYISQCQRACPLAIYSEAEYQVIASSCNNSLYI